MFLFKFVTRRADITSVTGTNASESSLTRTVRSVLTYLGEHSPFPSWMLIRTIEGTGVVVSAVDQIFGLSPQQVVPADLLGSDHFANTALVVAPVRLQDGTTFGSLTGLAAGPDVDHPELIESMLDMLADTIGALVSAEFTLLSERRTNEIKSAPIDGMTGLATRQAWEQQVRREDQRCRLLADSVAVILVELDELKHHNELHGHEAGDGQLREAAALLTEALQGKYFAARMTGDQFGVLLVNCTPAQVTDIETSLRRSLSAAGISAVLGTAQHRMGEALATLVAEAEGGVEKAQTARPTVTTTLSDTSAASVMLEALERGAIRAYFQPIVDLRSGEVVCIEALARWQGEDGVREPDRFLPLMHQEGLLGALFERILDDGLAHLAEFRHISPDLRLAVNFEFDSIPEAGLKRYISDRLAAHGLPADALSLELSERQTFNLSSTIRKELIDVADLGVVLMLDDFGTGFASLETLTTLPISGVKLDRRFTGQVVGGDREPAVVKAMISMAAEAGLVVVAAGIETQTQCDRLVRLGCRLGQGYLFALPQPPESLTPVLSAPLVSTF